MTVEKQKRRFNRLGALAVAALGLTALALPLTPTPQPNGPQPKPIWIWLWLPGLRLCSVFAAVWLLLAVLTANLLYPRPRVGASAPTLFMSVTATHRRR